MIGGYKLGHTMAIQENNSMRHIFTALTIKQRLWPLSESSCRSCYRLKEEYD